MAEKLNISLSGIHEFCRRNGIKSIIAKKGEPVVRNTVSADLFTKFLFSNLEASGK